MVMKRKKKVKVSDKLLSKVKENIGVILLIFGLITGIFALDGRYNKEIQAQQQKQETIKNFDQLNKNLIQQKQQNDLMFLQQDERRLYDRERSLKRDLSRNPKDQVLMEELRETQKERDDVKNQINILKTK